MKLHLKITTRYIITTVKYFTVSVISLLYLTACEKEKDYSEFAKSYHNLLYYSDSYDEYLASVKPQEDELFYKCLDKHRIRHHNEAQARIDACHAIYGDDTGSNFNCNIQNGTEIFEARRDLLELEKYTLQLNLNLDNLKQQGFYLGEIECLSINLVRSYEGQETLSCIDIAIEYKQQYMDENHCKFKKKFYEGDWSI